MKRTKGQYNMLFRTTSVFGWLKKLSLLLIFIFVTTMHLVTNRMEVFTC